MRLRESPRLRKALAGGVATGGDAAGFVCFCEFPTLTYEVNRMTEINSQAYLSNRRELLFLYDVKMGNPNGDPDENRPRMLPDGTIYVTDVRLKRYIRDYFKQRGLDILVDQVDQKSVTLTSRIKSYLNQQQKTAGNTAKEYRKFNPVDVILQSYIDARVFGSALAFKKTDDQKTVFEPTPKTITGPVQFNMGEVLHQVDVIDIAGTSIMASKDINNQGTFTDISVLRYGLIGFSGVANQYSAQLSQMTDIDYDRLLVALWNGVRANTRSKVGQTPLLLLSVEYHDNQDFQFGRLHDFVQLVSDQSVNTWSSPADYTVNLVPLIERLAQEDHRIQRVRFTLSSELQLTHPLPSTWKEFPANDWIDDNHV